MTNILAAIVITLVTNTVETDNHRGCDICLGIRENGWAMLHTCSNYFGTYVPATKKYVTTTCVERTICSFEYNGEKRSLLVDERFKWKRTQTFKKKDEWVPDGSPLEMHQYGSTVGTNCTLSGVIYGGPPTITNIPITNGTFWPLTSRAIPTDVERRLMKLHAERDAFIKDQVFEIIKQRAKEGK
jgi:hypothetical protein